jgi:CubicO group peptidase (beta-lactamase class C family)
MIRRPTAFFHALSARKTALLIFLLLIAAGSTAAQRAASADLGAQVDRAVAEEMKRQQMPAATVAIAQDGRIIYSKAFGMADVENNVAATTETLIRTGSLAKPITAVAAMTLVEAGKLDLDAPVQKYCPAFPQKQWPITTRELLSHTSGIRHYKGDETDSARHFKSMSDGFSIFASDPLLFEPGTKFSYSTYGYTVAGCVIEGASGEKFYDYLREHVLAPAGMTHTFVDDAYAIIPHRARGYQKISGQLKNAGLMDSSYKIPGGGLVMTAEDFARFQIALMDGRVVKPQTLAAMWTPTRLPDFQDGKPSNMGMGFGVLTIDGEKYVAHSGGQQGTSTVMAIIPEKRFGVAVFVNDDTAAPFDIVRQILDLYHMPRPKPAGK